MSMLPHLACNQAYRVLHALSEEQSRSLLLSWINAHPLAEAEVAAGVSRQVAALAYAVLDVTSAVPIASLEASIY